MSEERIIQFLARAIVLVTSIPVHESAHGLVAYWLGDPTARQSGRITLNPFRHFDLIGSVSMIFAGIGWAKPVPVDARYFRKPKRDMAITALAGPVSNILMATLALIILKLVFTQVMVGGAFLSFLFDLLYYTVSINIGLAIFNMIPVPPFDGSRIFLSFLPTNWYFSIMKYERYIFIGLFLLLVTGVLNVPLSFLRAQVFIILDRATWFFGRITF